MSRLIQLEFKQVTSKKVSDFIMEQLEEAIILKELMSEEQLPTERELAEIFNVSRLAVREALSHLEHKGLIEKRVGAKGGTFVLPITQHAHRRTREEIREDWDNLVQLSEYRMLIEPEVARLAASRRTGDQIQELQHYLVKSMEEQCPRELFRALDVKIHLLIAKASGNELLEKSVRQIRTRINKALDLMPYNKDVRLSNIEHHRKLLEAIDSKDGHAAYEIMYAHLEHSLDSIRARVFAEHEGGLFD